MEARIASLALVALAILSMGAGARSQNFIVSAPTPQLAAEICQAAETYRRDLAIEWLGAELPPWQQPCPITAQVHPQLGAGGATSFMFNRGVPFGWTMNIQGSRERLLDSVLPHEITHTIFATHFGRPLPRWADEGACTTVEHTSEKTKQEKFLVEFLKTERGIPFNHMFAMTEYPRDILPLYSQGYSLARYLIHQGGKRKFVQYIGDGMQARNWTAATKKHYGFESLSELQVTWLDWVRQGSPDISQKSAVEGLADSRGAASSTSSENRPQQNIAGSRASWASVAAQNARTFASADSAGPPPAPTNFAGATPAAVPGVESSNVARPVSDGWYARKRDEVRAAQQSPPGGSGAPLRAVPAEKSQNVPPPPTRAITPISFESEGMQAPRAAAPADRKVLLQWSRDNARAGSDSQLASAAVNEQVR